MPPDGYEAVTLPVELVAQIDDHANAIGADSRADAIRSLFGGYDSRVSARVVAIDTSVVDDIAAAAGAKAADELEGRLR
ncbi:MAG: hypothetical protein ACLFSD_00080 [Salinivenus sp.]